MLLSKMDSKLSPLALENGLDLNQIITSGSLLQINEHYDDNNCENDCKWDSGLNDKRSQLYIGEPVKSLEVLRKQMKDVDENGLVKKKVLEEGGGIELNEGNTVTIVYSGFWENEEEPFDVRRMEKPLVIDLKENGLLPGLLMAIKSMLVGEMSVFHLSHKVMYGELGVPPRIKPAADCIFYIRLIKSTITAEQGELDFSEPNTFRRVHREVKMLYSSGVALYKVNNLAGAIQLFRKGIFMLHKCRLGDEAEEHIQEKFLVKLYINLAICYNKSKQPLKACTACNELGRLNSLWNNSKGLFQNAKALRMIGQFNAAEKRLTKAIRLCPDNEDMISEYDLLQKLKESYNHNKLTCEDNNTELVSTSFKQEVDALVKNFKENDNLCKLTLPGQLNTAEMDYIREVCIRENLFFNKTQKSYLLDKDENNEDFQEIRTVEDCSDFSL